MKCKDCEFAVIEFRKKDGQWHYKFCCIALQQILAIWTGKEPTPDIKDSPESCPFKGEGSV